MKRAKSIRKQEKIGRKEKARIKKTSSGEKRKKRKDGKKNK